MKRAAIFTGAILVAVAATAQSPGIFSISTGPGEDAAHQACISWATDTTITGTYVLLTEKGSRDTTKFLPQQQARWDVFNGVWSNDKDGKEFYEDAVFTKCGTVLTGLRADTDYEYVIASGAERSGVHSFRTAGSEKWSACLISDFHSYPPLPKRLEAAMGMIGTIRACDPSVDWVLSPGDVVSWGGSYSFWKRLFEEPEFARMMWGRVNGNHDNWTKESQVTHNFDIPNDYFLGTSYFPRNGYDKEMGVCYHFRYGNTLFVMLNSEDLNGKGETQAAIDWVRSVVMSARKGDNPPTFVVVCQHWEWFIGTNGRTSEYKRWHELFDELDVDLAVAGNNHVYVRTHPLYRDGITDGRRNGTVYLQTPSCDNDRGRKISDKEFRNSDRIAFRWSEGSHTVGAVHMAVDRKSITLTLIDRNGNKLDSCVIRARH